MRAVQGIGVRADRQPLLTWTEFSVRPAVPVLETMLWVLVLLYGLSVFIVSGWIFVWCLHVTAILNAKLNLHKKPVIPSHDPQSPPPGSTVIAVDSPLLPPVSVIKPLVGVDPYLASNLDSFFCMQYPVFELLFCVNDNRDSALEVVRKLMAKYPAVDAKVFVGGSKVGTNPKINNMQPGYEAAAYDLILISDSGIKSKHHPLTHSSRLLFLC